VSELTPGPAPGGPAAAGRPDTVLIVDDSRTMRTSIRLHLNPDAYVFAEAATAERALTLARLLRPAAAVVDLQLPGLDGIDFTARLRLEKEAHLRSVGIVLVTGGDVEAHRERALAAGVDAILLKPLDAAVLRATVERLVRRQRA